MRKRKRIPGVGNFKHQTLEVGSWPGTEVLSRDTPVALQLSPLPHLSPGGLICLTTRSNPSNLPYKRALEAVLDSLEQAGAWERLVAQPVEHWELATSEQEMGLGTCANDGFISGIIYLYRKQGRAQGEREAQRCDPR